ncbi:MAG: hypothetical protein Greene041619_340 [Candidatus Peregrinibacteria bacterium Greene0416_19]|nr:MAG: hypothetical protein Greene041619_340 [Candidatus Peregrinibacteria bacterium Greene0416_19]
MGLQFRRQHPVGRTILDFYCHSVRLGIELDGSIHDAEEQREEDIGRQEYLAHERHIRIIRFSNDEIFNDLPSVLRRISYAIQELPPSPVGGGGRGVGAGAKKEKIVDEEKEIESIAMDAYFTISVPPTLLSFILPKGSIALDGVSLTVAAIEGTDVTVALIPTTLRMTTLGALQPGDPVNVETDMLVRAAVRTVTIPP